MLKLKSIAIVIAGALLLGACGSTPQDRTLSGAGSGAAVGGGIGLLAGGIGVVPGILIGGATGGAIGALTDKDDFYLGEPLWHRPAPRE